MSRITEQREVCVGGRWGEDAETLQLFSKLQKQRTKRKDKLSERAADKKELLSFPLFNTIEKYSPLL